jgi:hypothetical protein
MSRPEDAQQGWKPDPTGRHAFRWWDGTRWTDDVGADGVNSKDPYDGPQAAEQDPHELSSEQRLDPRRQAIERVLADKLRNKFLVRKEIKRLTDYLAVDEELITAASGMYEDHTGLLAVTDRRLLFLDEGIVRKRQEEFHYSRISSAQWKSGMVMAEVKIFASSNVAVIGHIAPKERAQEIAGYISRRIAEGSTPQQAAAEPVASEPPALTADPIDQNRRLAELRDLGAITADEFEAKKTQLLGQL